MAENEGPSSGKGGNPGLARVGSEAQSDAARRVRLDRLLPGPFEDDALGVPPTGAPGKTWRALGEGVVLQERFRLGPRIGSGGLGQVFRAEDLTLGKTVAVKVLNPALSGDARSEEMIRTESRILAALEHPGVVPIHHYGRDGGLAFLVMDFVEGSDLASVIARLRRPASSPVSDARERAGRAEDSADRRGSTAPATIDMALLSTIVGSAPPEGRTSLIVPGSWFQTVARIACEVANILEAAHARNIVHRDLTPRNVMLRRGGIPVVLDFGLAGTIDSVTGFVTGGLYGTPSYVAPEQISANRSGIDPRTDVYQLGLLLYELCTLRPAFSGATMGVILRRITNGDFVRPRAVNRGVPASLEAIALKAMEVDPARRYMSAGELREDLERFLSGRTPMAGGATLAGRLTRDARYYLRRHPFRVTIGGAAASIALSLMLYSVFASRPEPLVSYAWVLPGGAGAPKRLEREARLRPGDWLGIPVEAPGTVYVYALTVTGGEERSQQYLRPIQPISLVDLERRSSKLPEGSQCVLEGPWALRIPRGTTDVGCSEVLAGEEGEGLLAFVSRERLFAIEAWFDRLIENQAELESFPGVPRVQAEALYPRSTDDVRGGSLRELSEEELNRHLGRLIPEAVMEGSNWNSEVGTRFETWFRVQE